MDEPNPWHWLDRVLTAIELAEEDGRVQLDDDLQVLIREAHEVLAAHYWKERA